MICTIDAGNSNIAVGVFDGDRLTHHWRIATRRTMTADEWAVTVSALFAKDAVDPQSLSGCVVSSVVPSITESLADGLALVTGSAPLVVSVDLDIGLIVAIDNPRELGTDLFANAVGGYGRFGGACVVVDFGTALSVTAVSADAEIRGVSIAPGINAALSALVGNAAQLTAVPLKTPDTVIGTNTVRSIQSGIMHGYRGLVETLVHGTVAELGGEVKVVATGGQASVLGSACDCFDEIDPWLTLDGLRRILEAHGLGTS